MPTDKFTILAVDDKQDNLTTLKAVLNDAFPRAIVVTASTGTRCIELALEKDPDVILLDIVMPGMDGFEVCRRLKNDERLDGIPVVFLTALRTDRESRIKALNVGAEGFLSKPIDEEELTAQVRAMVKIKRANDFQRIESQRLSSLVAERTEEIETELAQRIKAEQVQRRLATAIEQAGEGVVITDADWLIQYVNPAMQKMSGYTRDELIGKTPRILKSGVQGEVFYEELWMTIKTGKIWSGRFTSRRKDGSVYHEEATISPVKDQSGRITNFVAVNRDITEHLELSQQLLQSQKMEALGTLAGGIAHDFNNLLQVTLGYSELHLADQNLPKQYREDLEKINDSARRGADLVQRLLTLSRKTETKPQSLSLNQRIVELRKILERTIPKMIDIQLMLVEDLTLVNADPTQVDQALMNLCINARDAMPEGGALVLKTENIILNAEHLRTHPDARSAPYALLSVSDTGQGMDRETMQHIYEPFFTTKGVGKGTGLGLAMVYSIIKNHGGFVSCNSELGKGTIFKIYLPAVSQGNQ